MIEKSWTRTNLNKAVEAYIVPGKQLSTSFTLTVAEPAPVKGVRTAMMTDGDPLQTKWLKSWGKRQDTTMGMNYGLPCKSTAFQFHFPLQAIPAPLVQHGPNHEDV